MENLVRKAYFYLPSGKRYILARGNGGSIFVFKTEIDDFCVPYSYKLKTILPNNQNGENGVFEYNFYKDFIDRNGEDIK